MRRVVEEPARVRGALKVVPEDFVVEEIAESEPDGEGPHVLLWVEKRALDTQQVVQALGRALGLPAVEIGVAGLKDRQAVTRQWMSVPAHSLPLAENGRGLEGALEDGLPSVGRRHTSSSDLPSGDGWRVLLARRHGSKLRTGRLAGNAFRIRARGGAEDASAAESVLTVLAESGLPNYFGRQRFGRRGDNAARGREIVVGARLERKRFKRRMYLSALQAELFNCWLDCRMDDGLLNRALLGDLLRDRRDEWHDASLRYCENPEAERDAVAEGLSDPTGPIFGARMQQARGEAALRDASILEAAGLDLEDLFHVLRDAPGSRRSARAWMRRLGVEKEGDDLLLRFELERGAYATVVLAQLGLTV